MRGRKKTIAAPEVPPTEAKIGGVAFALYPSLMKTVNAVAHAHVDQLRAAFAAVVDGIDAADVALVPYHHLNQVVGGVVQRAWYTYQGKEYPDRVRDNQLARCGAAIAALNAAKAPPIDAADVTWEPAGQGPVLDLMAALKTALKPKRSTGKTAAVRELIDAGKSDDEILTILKPTYPTLIPATIRHARHNPLRKDI